MSTGSVGAALGPVLESTATTEADSSAALWNDRAFGCWWPGGLALGCEAVRVWVGVYFGGINRVEKGGGVLQVGLVGMASFSEARLAWGVRSAPPRPTWTRSCRVEDWARGFGLERSLKFRGGVECVGVFRPRASPSAQDDGFWGRGRLAARTPDARLCRA